MITFLFIVLFALLGWRDWPKTRSAQKRRLALLVEASDCEARARDYDLSDPYLAGVNSGRAEMLRRWAYDEHQS